MILWTIVDPVGRRPGAPSATVYDVIDVREDFPGQGGAFEMPSHHFMQRAVRPGKRADGHTDGTARAHFGPIIKAGLRIQLPSGYPVVLLGFTQRYGLGGAAFTTFQTGSAEVPGPQIDGLVRDQFQVGHYGE